VRQRGASLLGLLVLVPLLDAREVVHVPAVDQSLRWRRDGRKRRGKSLRNGVHIANGVVWEAVSLMMMSKRRRDATSGRRGGDGRGADAAVGSARAARRRRRGVIDVRDAAAKTKTTRDGRTRGEARRRSASSSSSSSSSPQRLRPQIRRTVGKGRDAPPPSPRRRPCTRNSATWPANDGFPPRRGDPGASRAPAAPRADE